jgi:hypothetical protein
VVGSVERHRAAYRGRTRLVKSTVITPGQGFLRVGDPRLSKYQQ